MTVLFNMDDTSFSFLFFTNTLLHIKLRPTLSESNLSKNGLSIFYAELKEPYIYVFINQQYQVYVYILHMAHCMGTKRTYQASLDLK
jgi:hypothetical protein